MIINQSYLFAIFMINGIIIGILFDIFRILRKIIKTSDMFTYLEDIIFWILTGATILYSAFVFNNGQIRLFMFLAIILGCFIYMILLSSKVIKINVTIINFIKQILIKILKILALPFQYIYKLLRKILLNPIVLVFINIRKKFIYFYKKISNNLKIKQKDKNKIKI
ncbi:MAG: spore cortex biosynthesis protein YabQ [Clostridia bacterium]